MINTAAIILNITETEVRSRIATLAHAISKHEKHNQSEAWKKAWREFKKQIALRIEERDEVKEVEALSSAGSIVKGKKYIAIKSAFGCYAVISEVNGKKFNQIYLIGENDKVFMEVA